MELSCLAAAVAPHQGWAAWLSVWARPPAFGMDSIQPPTVIMQRRDRDFS